jgi:hypothetical protein
VAALESPAARPPRIGRIRRGAFATLAVFSVVRTSFAQEVQSPERRAPSPPPEVRFAPNDADVSLLVPDRVEPVVGWGYGRRWRWRGWRRFRYGPVFLRSYTPVCTGPCTARFLPGEYDFALEKNGRIVQAPPVVIQRSSTLEGHYTDRSETRLAGMLIAIVGITGGAVIMWNAVDRRLACDSTGYCFHESEVNGPLLATGLGVFIGSAVVGSILAWQPDVARITVSPLSLPPAGRREEGRRLASVPDGVAVGLRF